MMMEKTIWWDWILFDEEEGLVIGLKSDAPEKIVKAYKEHLKQKNLMDDDQIKT